MELKYPARMHWIRRRNLRILKVLNTARQTKARPNVRVLLLVLSGLSGSKSLMTRLGLLISVSVLVTTIFAEDIGPQLTDARFDQAGSIRAASKPTAPNPEIRSLLDDAEALPPEFASDVLLQLVENGFIHDDSLKIKVLSRAFNKAAAAQDDVMRRPLGANVEETSQGLHALRPLLLA